MAMINISKNGKDTNPTVRIIVTKVNDSKVALDNKKYNNKINKIMLK
jgi:hypothetical protein